MLAEEQPPQKVEKDEAPLMLALKLWCVCGRSLEM